MAASAGATTAGTAVTPGTASKPQSQDQGPNPDPAQGQGQTHAPSRTATTPAPASPDTRAAHPGTKQPTSEHPDVTLTANRTTFVGTARAAVVALGGLLAFALFVVVGLRLRVLRRRRVGGR